MAEDISKVLNKPAVDAEEAALRKKLLEAELSNKLQEAEERKLMIEERRANLEDHAEKRYDRALKKENKELNHRTNGATLAQENKDRTGAQNRCNHRKGGDGMTGIVQGRGNDSDMAIIKHTFMNGDTWVRCMRCAKHWKPPVRKEFTKDGVFNESAYNVAFEEHRKGLDLYTKNSPSGSYIATFSDGGEYFREVTAASTLR